MSLLRTDCRCQRIPRGVSTLEVVIALSVFLIVALGLASASVRLASQAARNEVRLATVEAIDTRLALLSGAPFDELVAGSYVAPDACGEAGTVAGRTSCVQVTGREIRITYAVGVGSDPVAGTGSSAAYVDLAATGLLPDGSTVRRSVRVPAPSIGWTSDGAVLRVRTVSGTGEDLPPISLIDSHGGVVVEGVPFVAGSAVVRVDGDACAGDNAPCRVALSGDPASWWTTAGWTLSPATITGGASELELTPGTLSETTVDAAPIASARVAVLAQPDGKGPVGGAPEGTVCVTASFNDGSSARLVPYCNSGPGSEGGSYIPINSWPSSDGSTTYHFPTDFTVRVTADRPDGTCPAGPLWGAGSAKGAAPGNVFIDADVCTTWTWGHPTLGGLSGDAPTPLPLGGLEVRLTSEGSTYDLIWAASNSDGALVGLPAAGAGAVPPWAKPRAAAHAGTCATDSDPNTVCTAPAVTPTPETSPGAPPECATDAFCLSVWNQAPRLTNPTAPYTIPVTDSDENRFKVGVADADSATWELVVINGPAHGELTDWAGNPIVDIPLGHLHEYEMRYVHGPTFTGLDQMVLQVTDDSGLVTTTEVGLYSLPLPWTITGPDRITIAQNETGQQVRVRVTDTTGANSVGVSPYAGGLDLVASAPSPTDAEGYSTFTLDVGAVPAGPRTLLVGAGTRGIAIPVDVVPTPTAVTITALDGGPQGGTGSVTVSATEATGAPYAGGTISLGVTRDGSTTGRVRPELGRCTTDAFGVCTTQIQIDSGAKSGTYTLTASAGTVTTSGTLTVTQVPSTLTVSGGRGTGDRFAESTNAFLPSAWFRLDERNGTTASSAVGGSDGTYHGGPALGAAPLVAGGDSGAVSFDGLNDRMCAPGVTVGSTATLEVWAKFTGFANDPSAAAHIWGRADDGTTGFALVLGGGTSDTPDTLRLNARINGHLHTVAAPTNLFPGRTYHLTGVYDGEALRLYVDGTALAALHAPGTLSGDGEWCAGGAGLSSPHVAATLDEPAAYPYAMNSARVTSRTTLGRVTGAGGGWVTLPQGGAAQIPVTVLDAAGDPVAGHSVTVSLTSDRLSVPDSTVTTGAGGHATFTLEADLDAPAGVVNGEQLLVSAAGASVPLSVEVSAVPASISVEDITVVAGGRVPWPVTVLDAAGAPVPGWSITATAIDTGEGLRLSGRATTSGGGQARPWVGAGASESGSTHTVLFSAGGASREATVTVTAAVAKFETVNGPFRLPQGSTATWQVRVTDVDGGSLGGVPVEVGCSGCGLTFEDTATEADGTADIEVTDIDGVNPEGTYDVVVSIGGSPRPARIAVRAAVAELSLRSELTTRFEVPPSEDPPVGDPDDELPALAPVNLKAGSTATVTVTALDADGNAVPGVAVTGSGPSGVTVNGGRTDGRGRVTLTLRATGTTGAGSYTVTFSADSATADIDVEVTP